MRATRSNRANVGAVGPNIPARAINVVAFPATQAEPESEVERVFRMFLRFPGLGWVPRQVAPDGTMATAPYPAPLQQQPTTQVYPLRSTFPLVAVLHPST